MKLYIANGRYIGTQADAKKLDKDFEQVEVPTDKEGLLDYLNGLSRDVSGPADEYTTIVERQDPPVPTGPSHSDQSVAIDDAWDALPLARKLHFGSLALEEARELVPVLQKQAVDTGIATKRIEAAGRGEPELVDEIDDELFS